MLNYFFVVGKGAHAYQQEFAKIVSFSPQTICRVAQVHLRAASEIRLRNVRIFISVTNVSAMVSSEIQF
jgi:hypothetical protein